MRATVYHQGKHLRDSDVYPATDACPLCLDSTPRRRVAHLQQKPDVYLLDCSVCGVMSASAMPKPEVLDRYYQEYYTRPQGQPRVTIDNVRTFGKWVAGLVQGVGAEHAGPFRILDFGGGDGSLAIAIAGLQKRPCEITVIDLSGVSGDAHNPDIIVSYVADLSEVEGSFDLVIASAVLEHIPDCRTVLVRLWQLVASGGCFYARTPYLAPFLPLIPKMDFTYPGHVHDMGPGFWNRITTTLNLEAVTVVSQPTRSETGFRQHFFRTLAATVLKAPARLELSLRHRPLRLFWPFVGGWEIVLRKN